MPKDVSDAVHQAVFDRESRGGRTAKCQHPRCRRRFVHRFRNYDYHMSHNRTKRRGGSNAADNILLLCAEHNQEMRQMTWDEYMAHVEGAPADPPQGCPTPLFGQPLLTALKEWLLEQCVPAKFVVVRGG